MIWHRPKDRHHHDVINVAQRRADPLDRRQPMRSGHVVPAGPGAWHLLAPVMSVSTHAVIDDDAGRPTPDRGGVFTYLGLAAGTRLVTDIVLPGGVRLALAAGDRLRLGRSRKDDFGQVQVLDIRRVSAPGAPGLAAGEQVKVWCVSDVLLRDPWGAPDPSPQALAAELGRRLGVPVDADSQVPGALVAQAHRAARRESFHSRWGRPRPSLVGMAAGSVVTVRVGADVPGTVLAAVQRDGLGERTAEGFGQVRFGAPEVTIADPWLTPFPGVALPGEPPSGLLPAVPDALERAAVTAEVARRVAVTIAGGIDAVVPGASQVTSRAQWGSLRQQMARLGTAGGREAVARWFQHSRDVRQRRAIWGETALDTLERLLTSETGVWTVLGLDGAELDPFVLAPDRADAIRAVLRQDAVIMLVAEISREATLALQAAGAPQ
jgi:CRISPR-associated protein Csx10